MNRHPVDRLADVRAEKKKLEEEEVKLRQMILDGKCDSIGDEYEATVRVSRSDRLDRAAVLKEFGYERLRKFLTPTEITFVKVRQING